MIPQTYIADAAAKDGVLLATRSNVRKSRQSIYFWGEVDGDRILGVLELLRDGNVIGEYPCDVGNSNGFMASALPSGGLAFENAVSVVMPAAGAFVEKSVTICPRVIWERCDSVRFRVASVGTSTRIRAYLACFSDT
jgi:hypothetical protein